MEHTNSTEEEVRGCSKTILRERDCICLHTAKQWRWVNACATSTSTDSFVLSHYIQPPTCHHLQCPIHHHLCPTLYHLWSPTIYNILCLSTCLTDCLQPANTCCHHIYSLQSVITLAPIVTNTSPTIFYHLNEI